MENDQRHKPEEAYLNEMQVAQLAASGCFSRALAVAAGLGIADITNGNYMSHGDIAERTESDPELLLRLMQTLTLCGVFERDEKGNFGVTEKFAPLRSDHSQSMRKICILMADTYNDAFGALFDTVQTGKAGFCQVFGASLYEYLENNPDAERIFDNAMAELSRPAAAALVNRYDFSSVNKVLDIGGGGGAMLVGILADNPHLEGLCVDRPSVCERASAKLRASADHQLAESITFQPANIFEKVPEGGDRYLLKNVLHDWPLDMCVRILTAVGRAMRRTAEARDSSLPQPRLLVMEPLIEQDSDAARALFQAVVCEEGTRGFEEPDMYKLLNMRNSSTCPSIGWPADTVFRVCAICFVTAKPFRSPLGVC